MGNKYKTTSFKKSGYPLTVISITIRYISILTTKKINNITIFYKLLITLMSNWKIILQPIMMRCFVKTFSRKNIPGNSLFTLLELGSCFG
jgi:hypothetical protein